MESSDAIDKVVIEMETIDLLSSVERHCNDSGEGDIADKLEHLFQIMNKQQRTMEDNKNEHDNAMQEMQRQLRILHDNHCSANIGRVNNALEMEKGNLENGKVFM